MRGGGDLSFNSAFRTSEHQSELRNDPNAITPAETSLHSAGFAIDVNYRSLADQCGGLTGDQQRTVIREAAAAAGLGWGGNFNDPDPPHFYYDSGGNREDLVNQAQQEYLRLINGN